MCMCVVTCLPQGIGAPACAMLLTRWFAASERGTYWGESCMALLLSLTAVLLLPRARPTAHTDAIYYAGCSEDNKCVVYVASQMMRTTH